jgi:protein transport protein SEC61 subunit gamma and related proteins
MELNDPENQPQVHHVKQAKEQGKWAKQMSEWWIRLNKFGKECRRVMKVTQKPNKEEFLSMVKITALGMTIVGLIGFVLSMIQQLIL